MRKERLLFVELKSLYLLPRCKSHLDASSGQLWVKGKSCGLNELKWEAIELMTLPRPALSLTLKRPEQTL